MKEAEARSKTKLQIVVTKTAERNTRAAQKQAVVDMNPEAIAPKSKENAAPAPEGHDDQDQHSYHQFPNARDLS